MIIEDVKCRDYLKKKQIDNIPFRSFDMITQSYKDGNYYQILCNQWLYIVLKIDGKDQDNIDIYDCGLMIPMKFSTKNALIYEVTIPESRELLGLNFKIGI